MSIRHKFFTQQLEGLVSHLEQRFEIFPRIGGEMEFYLRSSDTSCIENVIEKLAAQDVVVEPEKGWQQYECVFNHTLDVVGLANQMHEARHLVQFLARNSQCCANFEAKPFEEDYGSAIHIHLSIHDGYGFNLFGTQDANPDSLLGKAIAGVLDICEESIFLLCRNEDSLGRFKAEGFLAPTHVSWGGNNRTTVLRIPDSPSTERRLEFRLPPASADPAISIFIVLVGLIHGLSTNLKLPGKIYGNAFDKQYDLQQLPGTLEEAKSAFEEGGKILHYMRAISPKLKLDFEL